MVFCVLVSHVVVGFDLAGELVPQDVDQVVTGKPATEEKRALGDGFTVRYSKAFEDRNRTEPTTIEIAGGP